MQHGWAYTSVAQIYKNPIHDDRLEFKFGYERILVKIPPEIQQEIMEVAKPTNNKEEKPSFVYDFLACKAYESKDPRHLDEMKVDDFRWVEVKAGNSGLSPNQIAMLEKIKLPLIRCRVANVLASPKEVKIYWDVVDSEFLSRFKVDSTKKSEHF